MTEKQTNEGAAMKTVETKFWTNDDELFTQPIEGDVGLLEVEKTDPDEYAIHLRHYADESAFVSAYLTAAQALALAHALTAVALDRAARCRPS